MTHGLYNDMNSLTRSILPKKKGKKEIEREREQETQTRVHTVITGHFSYTFLFNDVNVCSMY